MDNTFKSKLMPIECHFQKDTLFYISVLDVYVGSAWQLTTVIPVLKRQRQEDLCWRFKVIPANRGSSRTAQDYLERFFLKNNIMMMIIINPLIAFSL